MNIEKLSMYGGCILSDIDGTLLSHRKDIPNIYKERAQLIDGTTDFLQNIHYAANKIVLITGRPESLRSKTIEECEENGIFFDALLMGVGSGPRMLINDLKPFRKGPTSIGINLDRDKGPKQINPNDTYYHKFVRVYENCKDLLPPEMLVQYEEALKQIGYRP